MQIQTVHLIPIENNCITISKYFTLPLRVTGLSTKEQTLKCNAELSISKLSPDIWSNTSFKNKLFSSGDHTFEEIETELSKIKNIPLDHYNVLAKLSDKRNPTFIPTHVNISIMVLSVSVVLLMRLRGTAVGFLLIRHRFANLRKSVRSPSGKKDYLSDNDKGGDRLECNQLVITSSAGEEP